MPCSQGWVVCVHHQAFQSMRTPHRGRHISTPHWAALASARCRKHICTPVDPLFNNKWDRPSSRHTPPGMCRTVVTDTQTGMLPGIPGSAMCVQGFDDSLNSAIHTTYRISLRPSSLRLPRHPWFAIVKVFCFSRPSINCCPSGHTTDRPPFGFTLSGCFVGLIKKECAAAPWMDTATR